MLQRRGIGMYTRMARTFLFVAAVTLCFAAYWYLQFANG